MKKKLPSTWYPRPSTWNPRLSTFAKKIDSIERHIFSRLIIIRISNKRLDRPNSRESEVQCKEKATRKAPYFAVTASL